MAENISPEERLFRVIQQGKNPALEKERPGNKKLAGWLRGLRRFVSSIGSAASKENKGFDWKSIVPANFKLPELEPGAINKALAVTLVVVMMLVVYSSISKRQDTTKITDAVSKIQIAPIEGGEKIGPLKKIDFYIDGIRKRDIFHPAKPEEEAAGTEQPVSDLLRKTAENLKLQGISWGSVPKAMILWQNDKESNMYFLMKGQAIGSTGVKVKEIYRDKVVIGYNEEEMELL